MKQQLRIVVALALLVLGLRASSAWAEDGYDLWLRYRPTSGVQFAHVRAVVVPAQASTTIQAAAAEMTRAVTGMTGSTPLRARAAEDGGVLLGTPAALPAIAGLHYDLTALGREGYLVRSARVGGHTVTVVTGNSDIGVLYGTFALIAQLQRGRSLGKLDLASAPKLQIRMLDHWDNLDRSVERGYAGQSIWDWWTLPDYRDPRYTDYARANASIGINGAVLNNVNAKAESLTAPYIAKAAAIADMLRPYGIKVYLSARWSAPIELDHLPGADPLDPEVAAWWRAKAAEIHAAIPDFGGFLVEANSEGQPGPQDYHRTHAEGANMIAAAVRPYGGIVLWRAFVYAQDNPEDRAKQAYDDFKPLDGTFADNVIVQVKNGPIDFQPREPIHPLFGAMPATSVIPEFQITKEYLVQATHLVYLGPLFEEVLRADTYAHGPGSSVASVIERGRLTGMAGVANIGTDRDWAGSTFNQANWFAFGRMAWDPGSDARAVAVEWSELTFGPDPAITRITVPMMMTSREAVVNYMTPLGLAHVMATGHHYGPAPWVHDLARPEWNPVYYHRADAAGIGFDRTARGSNAIAQYAPALAARWRDVATTPEDSLLWFHHVAWDHPMASGRTLWGELAARYQTGVEQVGEMQRAWQTLAPRIDAERFAKTSALLAVQQREAMWWRDASLAYFSKVSGRALPPGYPRPAHTLDYYQALRFDFAPGR